MATYIKKYSDFIGGESKKNSSPETHVNKIKVVHSTNDTIKDDVKNAIEKYGADCDLNFIDVSNVTIMDNLFYGLDFKYNSVDYNVTVINGSTFPNEKNFL